MFPPFISHSVIHGKKNASSKGRLCRSDNLNDGIMSAGGDHLYDELGNGSA